MMRCRITYRKTAPLRYTGNLDIQKIWERYLRRAGLPVAYSQGFHPQPRIQQACPLPLGFLSQAELADIYLDDDTLRPEDIAHSLQTMPYPGIEIAAVEQVDLTEATLAGRVTATEYLAEWIDPIDADQFAPKVTALLNAPQLLRSRREKDYDLRPLIEALEVLSADSTHNAMLRMQLSARQGATGRPEEVVSELGYAPFDARYTRTRIMFTP
ncbi:MAG: TIGR03936 family radical SAM-associated protein [Bellilinea sp.]